VARTAKPITAVAIRKLKRPASGKPARLYDGNGLFFVRGVHKDVWRFRHRQNGCDRWLTLGEFPAMSLKEARLAADNARESIARGDDIRQSATFEASALRWLEHAGSSWTGKTYRKAHTWLERDVFPYIGEKRMDEIEAREILALLRRVEAAGNLFKVRRLHGYIRRVFSHAISHGDAGRNPAADLNLSDLFPPSRPVHRPAFTTTKDAGMLMRLIREYPQPVVRGALLMLAWTLSRPGEVRMMRWEDIDRQQWRYTVTKTNTPHAVPLPRQAMALLDELRPLTGRGELVFAGLRPGRPLSENTFAMALRSTGIDTRTEHCAHGFRAMGRTLLAEQGYQPELIERQLCHKQANDTVAAYARETLLRERTAMMQAWADLLDAWARGADVIPLRTV